jgi:hypothetical protein
MRICGRATRKKRGGQGIYRAEVGLCDTCCAGSRRVVRSKGVESAYALIPSSVAGMCRIREVFLDGAFRVAQRSVDAGLVAPVLEDVESPRGPPAYSDSF